MLFSFQKLICCYVSFLIKKELGSSPCVDLKMGLESIARVTCSCVDKNEAKGI
jgi:hypothetical protein